MSSLFTHVIQFLEQGLVGSQGKTSHVAYKMPYKLSVRNAHQGPSLDCIRTWKDVKFLMGTGIGK